MLIAVSIASVVLVEALLQLALHPSGSSNSPRPVGGTRASRALKLRTLPLADASAALENERGWSSGFSGKIVPVLDDVESSSFAEAYVTGTAHDLAGVREVRTFIRRIDKVRVEVLFLPVEPTATGHLVRAPGVDTDALFFGRASLARPSIAVSSLGPLPTHVVPAFLACGKIAERWRARIGCDRPSEIQAIVSGSASAVGAVMMLPGSQTGKFGTFFIPVSTRVGDGRGRRIPRAHAVGMIAPFPEPSPTAK